MRELPMTIMNTGELRRILQGLGGQFVQAYPEMDRVVMVGVQRRGVVLAHRLAAVVAAQCGINPPVGALDITLYRDDVLHRQTQPVLRGTDIVFSIDQRNVLLVDDVLFTGRTARAALAALLDIGRPDKIELLVLVDRDHRELPIQADYVGKRVMVPRSRSIQVHLVEVDGEDEVILT